MANIRKNTKAQWLAENPTLRVGELGVERDTKKEKIGDGVTPWVSLPYHFNKAMADASYAPVAGSTAYATPAAVAEAVAPKLDSTTAATTYVRFVDENGNPLTGRHVVVKVDSTTGDILDIVSEV